MSAWRDQRAEKERVEKEREEATNAAKQAKLASLGSGSSSAAPSTANPTDDLDLPSLGLTDEESRKEAEEKRLERTIARNEGQIVLEPVHIKHVVTSSQKPANTALALLKPTTTESVIKNQWIPHCSEGADSRSKILEVYQVKPNPDIMQTFEAARTQLEEAKPNTPLKTLYLFFGTTADKGQAILNDGFSVAFPGTITLYTDPIQAIPHTDNKEIFCCRVALGTPDIHYGVSSDQSKYTLKFGKHIIATYLFKIK